VTLSLDMKLRLGIQTIHRRTEPATGVWEPRIDELVDFVQMVDRCGYDSIWLGDHVSFPIPFFDPLLMIAQAAVVSRRLTFGTGVYLLPLRHPAPVAKQVATLDHLTEGRLIFGVGVGGEFPKEYELCGVPRSERGARLSEGIEVLRKLWTGEAVTHHGRFYDFEEVPMKPPGRQPGGPPVWCGGRSDAALRRAGAMADGYISYVVTPQMYADSLAKISDSAEQAGRRPDRYGTGHLLFARLDDSYEAAHDAATETLSIRYNMDFRRAAARYAALGTPQQVAERIREFHAAGVRHAVLDLLGPYDQRPAQIERFAAEVIPLLKDLTGA
jgi:probable F420-dependent oxidoreductase